MFAHYNRCITKFFNLDSNFLFTVSGISLLELLLFHLFNNQSLLKEGRLTTFNLFAVLLNKYLTGELIILHSFPLSLKFPSSKTFNQKFSN